MIIYAGWLNLYSLLLSLFILSLSWNTTYWIKDRENRILAFVFSILIYHFILQSMNVPVELTKDDDLFYFLYHTINGVIFNYSYFFMLLIAVCAVLLIFKVINLKK